MEKYLVPLSVVLSAVSLFAIAAWYVIPASDKYPRNRALVPFLLPHTFRFLGLWFLVPGVTAPTIDPGFTQPAAWGDLVAAGLAWLAILALRGQWSGAPALVWLFSVVGVLDLLDAMYQGNLRLTSPGELGATFLIPAVFVPLLLVSHVLIVRRMLRG
ncbi:MAG: hypothetical protein EKK41_25230 [Hyphomicrobiales bacterium]|nr:MAG: hypothetical protein EKK41_25230 [Hyphomicrobiales bacterium]